MANLELCDKHNMVSYLNKPTGSEGFQEIVDFLNGSHIRYALTKNPTIYVSLMKKFWQTATVRTIDNGEQEITATVDGKEFTITEVSVRRHLQLADVDAEEGEGSGHPSEPQPPPSTTQPTHEEPIPNVVSSSHQKTQTPRQALNQVTELPQTSEPIPNVANEAVYEEWDDKVDKATTTVASLDAEQASGNINRTQSTTMPNVPLPQGIGADGSPRCQEAMGGSIAQTRSERVPTQSYDSPLPRVHTLGSDKGNMTLQKIDGFMYNIVQESGELGGRLEANKKDDEEDLEDSSKQGRMIEEIDQDAGITLVTHTHSQEDQSEDYTGSGGISIASRLFSTAEELVSTAGASMPVSTAGMVQEVNINIPSPIVVKDKGKGKIEESEYEQSKRTKLQQEQDRLGHEAVVRLQEELDEEERERMARVHEAAQYFTEEEWENIRTRVEADEELSRRLQAEERNKYSKVDQAKMLNVNTFVPMETEDRGRAPELAAGSSQATIIDSAEVGSSKRAAEAELDHGDSKRQKTNEASRLVQEQPEEEEKELSQEDL
ncbi:hypothetical protein Tco_1556700 [Tanacetum coccineum]